ncbi:MAG TPA: hypothetical protein PKB10_08915, partial [Tepidisphaeraceae bacterium]|nr:hypothetical protein [Tepidisphaeraceae bacterium]
MRRLLAGITSSAFYSDFAPHSLGYAFNSDVSAGLSLDAFTLDHLSGSATLPRSGMSMTWDDGTHTATITPTSAGTPAILADGWYDAIWSEVNSPLTNEHKHTFRWLLGDFNNDGAVGEDDHTYFVSLLTGSGTPNGVGHSAGDVNFDGATNNLDISMFVAQYGKQVPALLRGPGDITAMTLSSTSIRVQWTAPAGATPDGYRIFRSTDGTNFTEIHEADDPLSNTAGFFWDDTTAAHGTKYWYRVRPFTFANGNGHTTPKVSAVTGMPAPVVTHLQGGDQIVRVVWDDHSHTESAFRITLRDTTTNQTFVEDVESDLVSGGTLLGQRSWMMAGLDASATYEVSVAATREGGAITSAAIPFTETVSTNAGQVDSGAGELIVSSYDYRWGNVQMDVNPPVPMLENPGYPDFGPEFYVDPEWPGY